jgi:hypothetical protein
LTTTPTLIAIAVAAAGVVALAYFAPRILLRVIFFLLLALQPLFLLALRVVAPTTLFGGLGYGLLRGWTSLPCLVLLGTSLATTVAVLLYHLVLLRTAPEGFDLYL